MDTRNTKDELEYTTPSTKPLIPIKLEKEMLISPFNLKESVAYYIDQSKLTNNTKEDVQKISVLNSAAKELIKNVSKETEGESAYYHEQILLLQQQPVLPLVHWEVNLLKLSLGF